LLELEHVALGDQPIAEVDAFDGETVAMAVDKARPFCTNEVHRRGESGATADCQGGDAQQGAEPDAVSG
jgi:hypothetical protein